MSEQALTRMEGLGNTFVILRGPLSPSSTEVVELCKEYGDKPADGLLVATAIDPKTVQMKYWNNDGSSAEMCGNGLRCLARFSRTNGLVDVDDFVVETDAGPLKVHYELGAEEVEIQVGKVVIADKTVEPYGEQFFEANVGNPHAITFVDDVESAPVTTLGPKVEQDSHFPSKTNVEFAQIVDSHHVALRVWERGVGETLACGTGMAATAAVFVTHKTGHYPVTIAVPGGSAEFWLDGDDYTRMRAPAKFVGPQ